MCRYEKLIGRSRLTRSPELRRSLTKHSGKPPVHRQMLDAKSPQYCGRKRFGRHQALGNSLAQILWVAAPIRFKIISELVW